MKTGILIIAAVCLFAVHRPVGVHSGPAPPAADDKPATANVSAVERPPSSPSVVTVTAAAPRGHADQAGAAGVSGWWAHRQHKRQFIIFARPVAGAKGVAGGNGTQGCAGSADEFPHLFDDGGSHGAVAVAVLVGIYCFTLLAIICDRYFLPCVERICQVLNLSQDVAAATFMSVATSAPELFVNIIGTFITKSDIGIGTIVGSSLFNALGVASLGGLAAAAPIKLDWWPLTRDVIIYIFSVTILVVMTWDGVIYWYEGLVLFVVYFLYFTVMFQNKRISDFVKRHIKKNNKVEDISKVNNNRISVVSVYGSYMEEPPSSLQNGTAEDLKKLEAQQAEKEAEAFVTPFHWPTGTWRQKLWFIYSWPIKMVLFCTVPDPVQFKKLFPITFLMCILWIGTNSYVVSWMISIIGNVYHIPDAVLGLTFLAAGGCLPEAISLTIMSRRGEGSMGVSNSLGANTMNILLSLGMPWFVKTISQGTDDSSYIKIESGSIEFTIVALIFAALILYLTLFFNKFHLSKVSGTILLLVYVIFLVLAVLSEMVFFKNENCFTKST